MQGTGIHAQQVVIGDKLSNPSNPTRDIQLQVLAVMRQARLMFRSIFTPENPRSTGGFIRKYEVPEMIRIASPIYLKTGGSVAFRHTARIFIGRAKRAKAGFSGEENDRYILSGLKPLGSKERFNKVTEDETS